MRKPVICVTSPTLSIRVMPNSRGGEPAADGKFATTPAASIEQEEKGQGEGRIAEG